MHADTRMFLLRSQQCVLCGYKRVLATHPSMPEIERVDIAARLRAAEAQLYEFSRPESESPKRAVA